MQRTQPELLLLPVLDSAYIHAYAVAVRLLKSNVDDVLPLPNGHIAAEHVHCILVVVGHNLWLVNELLGWHWYSMRFPCPHHHHVMQDAVVVDDDGMPQHVVVALHTKLHGVD